MQTDPTADPQPYDMLNLGDATHMNMNDFSADLLSDDLHFDNFPGDASFQSPIEPSLPPQDQPQNIPQPSVETQQQPDQIPSNGDYDGQDVSMSGVGAGPLPTGFGVQLPANVGSTLTDFTKRRNWSARVVEEIKDFLHILTPDGRIMYVSPSTKTLTGHEPSALIGKFMTTFIHADDNSMYVREFNESIASGNPLRFFFRFRKADETYTIFESHGHPHFSSDVSNFAGTSQTLGFCRGFFMMARPYPTKNASLLDSFLEHKIENERLRKRIADLKREEQEEIQQQFMSPTAASNPVADLRASSSISPSDVANVAQAYPHQRHTSSGEAAVPPSPHAYNGMPPPAKPPISNYALTQRNLDEALAASRPDSINDKMMRYEGANHLEGIEMLTGLRYRDGERSKGISTGAMSPMLVRGDAGIEIPPNALRANGRGSDERHSGSPLGEAGEKSKKKMKVTDEYVCTDCGTLDSPEWRRGPNGPKTLCNACGLRWAKQEKKRSGQLGGPGSKSGSISGTQPGMPGVSSGPGAVSGGTTMSSPQASKQPDMNGATTGGGNSGVASAANNGDATAHSGGQAVPAAGSSGNTSAMAGHVGMPSPSGAQASMGGLPRFSNTPAPNNTSPTHAPSMPPPIHNGVSNPASMQTNPRAGMMNPMASGMVPTGMMPGGMQAPGAQDPNQALNGMSFMSMQPHAGNVMGNMGMGMGMYGADPGGGGGGGQGGGGGSGGG